MAVTLGEIATVVGGAVVGGESSLPLATAATLAYSRREDPTNVRADSTAGALATTS